MSNSLPSAVSSSQTVAQPTSGTRAFVCGLSGLEITEFEKAYLRETRPWGVILFARNIDRPEQVKRLTSEVREALEWNAAILVDQEGGRVQRLKAPHWRRYPAAGRFGELEKQNPGSGQEAAALAAQLIADDLLQVGINVNCAPVLDLRLPGITDAIGDRAYDSDVELVTKLGRVVAEAYLQAGVVPVFKHLPGHGRAIVDSHVGLPRISADRQLLEATDFAPFRSLSDLPMAMTGHLVFDAIDPNYPATHSTKVLSVVRQDLGFEGALITDDLSMGALSGSLRERATASLGAGCDLALHCNGVRREMEDIRTAIPILEGISLERCANALSRVGDQPIDRHSAEARLDALLADMSNDTSAADPTLETRIGS